MEKANAMMSRRNCDVISSLPDHILHHILGFLKTKEAVQTCVLSKRWEHLWTSLPSLNFDPTDFIRRNYPLDRVCSDIWFADEVAGSERLVKFANALLLRHDPLALDVFRLSCQHMTDFWEHTTDWIRYAVQHKPRVLRLHSVLHQHLWQCGVYICTSLEELYLHRCAVNVSGIVNLPKLRKLSIHRTGQVKKNDLKTLLDGCPILDYLWLERCCLSESEISHKSLHHLTIISCTYAKEIPTMFISAPNLLSFCYKQSPPKITLNMPSLTCARLFDFGVNERTTRWGWKELADFLSCFVNVEILELEEPGPLWLAGVVLPELPLFQKLKDCSICAPSSLCCGVRLVTWILESSSNLRKLTLLERRTYPDNCTGKRASEWTDASLRVAISKCKSLEIVEVKYQRFNGVVRLLMDALIDGTKELKNVKISCMLQPGADIGMSRGGQMSPPDFEKLMRIYRSR